MISKNISIFLSCALVGVFAAPADVPPEKLQPTVIPIVAQSDELEPNGTYKFSYETGNGIVREETAYEKVLPRTRGISSDDGGEDDDDSNEIHVQRGSYSYTAPDGSVISVSYIADENGFQPIGTHIPRAPVLESVSNSADKSGRALKISDSSEAASAPTKASVAKKTIEAAEEKSKPEIPATVTTEEAKIASASEAQPEPAPESNETKTESVPVSTEVNKIESTSGIEQTESTSSSSVAIQELDTNVSTTEQTTTTVAASTTADLSTTEASEGTSVSVEVSTEAVTTTATAQSTTESEQTSTVLADQTSTLESNASTEQSSITSAPESTSSSETVGPSTSTEPVDQSSTKQAEQSSTNAPEIVSTEQPVSANTV